MGIWDPKHGFEGQLTALIESMWAFYPRMASIVEVQDWLMRQSRLDSELFICRGYEGLLRGAWHAGQGANSFLTSDNEFATSIFGLALSEDVSQLTKGSLKESLSIRGVKLCWGLGENPDQKKQVIASYAEGGIAMPPTGGTHLYPYRASKKLKLAHLAPAADQVSALPIDNGERTRLRMFRSVNPMNMYPLPQAGEVFTHRAYRDGGALPLNKKELGETRVVLECVLAFLEERYREGGFGSQFDLYLREAKVPPVDVSATRALSREITVRVSPQEGDHAASEVANTYDDFKEWAQEIVQKYGDPLVDRYANGKSQGSDPAALFPFMIKGFDDEYNEYNCVYEVAGDTRVSALDYFLLLDERFGGDPNAIFRPGRSSTGRRLKPLINFERDDIDLKRVWHLELFKGEVKGWNVLSRERNES